MVDGPYVATVGSQTGCGATIVQGSPSGSANGKAISYIGCTSDHGGVITSGSPNHNIATATGSFTGGTSSNIYSEEPSKLEASDEIPQYLVRSDTLDTFVNDDWTEKIYFKGNHRYSHLSKPLCSIDDTECSLKKNNESSEPLWSAPESKILFYSR